MNEEMTGKLNEYYVRTDNPDALKRELGARAAVHAEIPITVTGTEDGEVFTRDIVYRVGEVSGEGGFLGRGTVVPYGTEATIRSMHSNSGDEYLVMDADLSESTDDSEPTDG